MNTDEHGETSKAPLSRGFSRGVFILDLVLRVIAVVGTLASAIAMGTTNQTLPFFTQFIRFKVRYSDFPAFTFFVVANSIVSAYLILSLPLSIVHIIRSRAKHSRLILILCDAAMLALVTAAASAAAAIVYLAHKGQCQGKLVCYMPAVRFFLRAYLWLPDWLVRSHGSADTAHINLRHCPGQALGQIVCHPLPAV
ncbi:hypothetical protein ACQ4PT_011552 [Festuca glaucescens]